jgi:ubiquitin thioesterase protein OTUB1
MSSTNEADIYRQTEARMEEIEAETKKQPLTSERCPVANLEEQYADSDANFIAGLKALQEDYGQMRTVRGDGNCYYRAFLYSLVEHVMRNAAEGQRILDYFKTKSWKDVLAQGYDEMALEIFYESVVDLLERVVNGTTDAAAFHAEMNEENATSDYCTWYLRVATATHLKQDPDRFLPFLMDTQAGDNDTFLDINQFCAKYIEPMGQECEQIQVLALAEAVGVGVRIEYLDGRQLQSDHNKLTHHHFGPEDACTHLTLLYRPGHYDILYKKE